MASFQKSLYESLSSQHLRKTSTRVDQLMKPIATRSPTCSCKKTHVVLLQNGKTVNSMTVSRDLSLVLKSFMLAHEPQL